MFALIEWFQLRFPKLQKTLLLCNHNFDEKDLNPYHLESDCWSHTMMVCKIAELSGYDKVVQIAALLHDLGKPASRKINPKNNHVQFFGHELISAQMANDVLNLMMKEMIINQQEKSVILELITHHGFLYKHPTADEMMAYFNNDKTFCTHLVELIRCDSLGRFCSDLSDEKKFQDLFEQINNHKMYHPDQVEF